MKYTLWILIAVMLLGKSQVLLANPFPYLSWTHMQVVDSIHAEGYSISSESDSVLSFEIGPNYTVQCYFDHGVCFMTNDVWAVKYYKTVKNTFDKTGKKIDANTRWVLSNCSLYEMILVRPSDGYFAVMIEWFPIPEENDQLKYFDVLNK